VIGDFSETCSQTTGEFLPNITVDKAKATKASDIYSLGLVLWEMVTRVPFEKLFDQDKKLLNCPSVLEKCIQQCLSKDPLFRPTAEALSLELKSALRDLQQKNRELLCMTLDRRDFKEAKEIYHGALQCYLYKEAPPLEEALGRGSFGRSYAGILQQQKVAVKLCSQGKESLARFYPEALIMKQMNRLKGITYYQRGIDPPIPSIIMKYYPNTLFNIVRDRKESFSTEQLYEWGRQLAAGLKEIHEKRLLHRDLRSANIFVDEDGKLVIGDFGEASWQTTAESRLGVNYMICAPEVTESLQTPKPLFMTTANDIYALGFILWEMAALPSLWYYTNGIPHSERNVEIDSLNCPSPFKEMIKACLHVNPAKRPSAEGLMRQFENLLHLSDERQNLGEKLEKFLMPNEKKEHRGKIRFFKSKSNKLEEEQKPTPHKSCLIC
jgi:serine/threonine protein kinase